PVEVRLVERGVTGDEVAESRHGCIMRGFPLNSQTGALGRTRADMNPVATPPPAVDILHHQPELPVRARGRAGERVCAEQGAGTPARCPRTRLTVRADLGCHDPAVIRHALTAVAEVKVRA